MEVFIEQLGIVVGHVAGSYTRKHTTLLGQGQRAARRIPGLGHQARMQGLEVDLEARLGRRQLTSAGGFKRLGQSPSASSARRASNSAMFSAVAGAALPCGRAGMAAGAPRIDAEPAGATPGGQDDLAIAAGTHEAEAALAGVMGVSTVQPRQ